VSNIPDYTSLLYVFTECLPHLKQIDNAFLKSNIMLNCSLWKDYEHYIYASSLLETFAKCQTLLNVEFVQGEVFGSMDALWRNASPKLQIPFDRRDDIENWLVRILLTSSFPSKRDSRSVIREYYSLNLVAFFRSIQHLIDLGYPKHWFSILIQSILNNDIRTRVPYPKASPNTYSVLNDEKKLNLSPILIEFEVVCNIFSPILGFDGDGLLKGKQTKPRTSLETIFQYELQFPPEEFHYGQTKCSNLLALVVEEKPGNFLTNIRDEMIDAEKVRKSEKHLFSVLKFDSKKRVVSFWMCQEKLAEMNKSGKMWYASLLRTDSWERICMPPTPIPFSGIKKTRSFLSLIK
jgi:hypothetical protein